MREVANGCILLLPRRLRLLASPTGRESGVRSMDQVKVRTGVGIGTQGAGTAGPTKSQKGAPGVLTHSWPSILPVWDYGLGLCTH